MSLQIIKTAIAESPVLKATLGADLEKYATSILAEIAKADLINCNPKSIVSAIKQACDLKLELDARQHCHLVKYKNNVQLQIGYRGFIYAIKRAYSDANIDVQLVYEGDEFKLVQEGDVTNYKLIRNNPFAQDKDIKGGFCYISYTVGNRLVSFCETVSINEIRNAKAKAKTTTIWDQWFAEKAKVVIIKRACKRHFAGINKNIQQISEYDNQEYDVSEPKIVEETSEVETITTDQAFELQELIKQKGKNEADILNIYEIDAIIQLPQSKFETLKGALCK